MEILMTGEIYLKKGPEIIKANPEELAEEEEEFAMVIEDLENANASKETINEIIERHETEMKLKEEGIKNYDGCDNFWISVVNEKGIEMLQKDYIPELEKTKRYRSKEDADKRFIRLRLFLEKANYVGKYFTRTGYIKTVYPHGRTTMDMSYNRTFSNRFHTTLVLYEYGDNMLSVIEDGKTNERRFQVISHKYLDDGNYEFSGEVKNEYDDKAELYQAILKQLLGTKKKKI